MYLCNRRDIFRVLSLVQIGLGLFLLMLEIRDYIILPTTEEMDNMYGGLVDLFKYKENTYFLIPLWGCYYFQGLASR